MKFLITTVVAFFVCFASWSCTVAPTAGAIHGYSGVICMGATATLTNDSTGGRWYSHDTTLALVNASTGFVTPVSPGVDTIIYILSDSCGADTVKLSVVVGALPFPVFYSSIAVGGYSLFTLPTGASLSGVSGAGSWHSGTDTLFGASVGECYFTVTSGLGCALTDSMMVDSFPSVSPIVVPASLHGCIGNTGTLTDATLGGTWSSNRPSVATINPSTGAVQELTTGTAILSYSVAGSSGTGWRCIVVMVDQNPASIAGPSHICLHDTFSYSTDHYWSVFSSTNLELSWSSSDSTIVGILPTSTTPVRVVADRYGSITLTATSLNSGCLTTTTINVDTIPVLSPLTGITTICSSISTPIAETFHGGIWATLNPSVGTVTSSGIFTGLIAGVDTVTYTATNSCGIFSKSLAITVNALPTLALITGPAVIQVGTTAVMANSTTGGTWSCSNAAVATVNASTGAVTGVTIGAAIITYTVTNSSGCVNFTTMAINIAPPLSVSFVTDEHAFSIFPNPVTDQRLNIFCQLPLGEGAYYTVADITGRVVLHQALEQATTSSMQAVSTASLKSGIYFMSIFDDGQKVALKFVVE